ncbi:hypothetical protein [Gaoshiqia sediminis]|uniref:Uncharacterized protein n=1 Tax=Gaoshiqia sediminis TaxID=2986998 RepID=A0AA41Y798_9BACT|nr:hypothetical protein [Gaoshiqia sediminis]MCW0483165.1 hypothetical protein [Gaoshiqia sediminis]
MIAFSVFMGKITHWLKYALGVGEGEITQLVFCVDLPVGSSGQDSGKN